MNTICPCFCCGKQISYVQDIFLAIDEGIEIQFFGGYGSAFDLSEMIIWICDQCLKEKEERVFVVHEDVTFNYEKE